jgi:glycosyltransferase involved in cell wall biosynthesis
LFWNNSFAKGKILLGYPTVAIDLTPVLPGGENGGAKIFALELIRGLGRIAPSAEFILLTHEVSHEELSCLDCHNVHRVMVVRGVGFHEKRAGLKKTYRKIRPFVPSFLRRGMTKGAYRAARLLARAAGGPILTRIAADLLFCPFTAPSFSQRNVPAVSTIYDLQFVVYPQFFRTEELALRKSAFLDACRKATMIVAISEYSRRSAIRYAKLASSRIKTVCLSMSTRMSTDEADATQVLTGLGLAPGGFLLYPANFWSHKNHEMLLTAFGIARSKRLPGGTKLVLTGAKSARRDFIQATAARLGLGEWVVFPGYLSNGELAALFNSAGGLIFPSLYEGFGLPVVEAMAAGVPVACSNVASLPEVAGNAAIFFDPRKPTDIAQAIIELVLDTSKRRQLIEAGYHRAQIFADSDQMALDYWRIFEECMARQRGSKG